MSNLTKYNFVLYVFFVISLCVPTSAYAYIDPGTGSLILQGLAAAAITGLAFIRSLREKILGFFRPKKDENK